MISWPSDMRSNAQPLNPSLQTKYLISWVTSTVGTSLTLFQSRQLTTDASLSTPIPTSATTTTLNESSVDNVNVNISDLLRTRCGTWDDEVQSKVDACSFWMEGVILTITGTPLDRVGSKTMTIFTNAWVEVLQSGARLRLCDWPELLINFLWGIFCSVQTIRANAHKSYNHNVLPLRGISPPFFLVRPVSQSSISFYRT